MNILFGDNGDKHAQKGIQAYDNSDFGTAIREIDTSLKMGVKSYQAHELLTIMARALHETDRNNEAIETCKKALSINRAYPPAWNNMGIAYRNKGDHVEAERCYLEAIYIEPDYVYAHISLGDLYINMGKPVEAIKSLEWAIKIQPNLSVSHANLALAYAMVGEFEKANICLKQAITLGYKPWKVISDRIQALAASHQMYVEQEKVSKPLEPAPGHPITRYPATEQGHQLARQAEQLYASGKRRDAADLYRKILEFEPNCSFVIVKLGSNLQEDGRIPEAIQLYTLAIKIDPQFGYAYYARGWAKHFLKDYQGELDDAMYGMSLDSQNRGMYLRRIGAAYAGMKRFHEALDYYSQAIELNPKDEGTIYNKGLCYAEMGEHARAIEEFSKALQMDPDWDWALLQRAQSYLFSGNKKKALDDINETLRLYPNHQNALRFKEDITKA